MPICRLCCDEKKPEELVLSLKQNLESAREDVQLIEVVDLFFNIEFNRDPCLPQRVCQSCRLILENFLEFISKVQILQNINFGRDNSDVESEPEMSEQGTTSSSTVESDEQQSMEASTSRRRNMRSPSSSLSSIRKHPKRKYKRLRQVSDSSSESQLFYKRPNTVQKKPDTSKVESKERDPILLPVKL